MSKTMRVAIEIESPRDETEVDLRCLISHLHQTYLLVRKENWSATIRWKFIDSKKKRRVRKNEQKTRD
jgi:hypothetical protein